MPTLASWSMASKTTASLEVQVWPSSGSWWVGTTKGVSAARKMREHVGQMEETPSIDADEVVESCLFGSYPLLVHQDAATETFAARKAFRPRCVRR